MKLTVSDLAIFGGRPGFKSALHVGCPNIGSRERLMARIHNLFDRNRLTNDGPYVQELERRIAEMIGVKHCVAMCNGTVALTITARAAGLAGEVILPSFTFIATAHALQWQGITPVFCDIDPVTCNLHPSLVEPLITSRTTGIVGVHLWGRPCDAGALSEIAGRHGLKLIFDAAHAFGCSHGKRMIGNFGDAEVFSFHATKFFNTFEGGAVVTNDDGLAERLRLMKNFGFSEYDKVISVGINGKMNEVSAAMGLTSLESIGEFVAINCLNYKRYQQGLKALPGVTMISFDERNQCNYQYIIVEVDEAVSLLSRDQLQEILWAENILARRYFYPGCHGMEPYRSSAEYRGSSLPVTDRLAARVLSLPTGTTVGSEQIEEICGIIRFAVGHGSEIRERLFLRPPEKSPDES